MDSCVSNLQLVRSVNSANLRARKTEKRSEDRKAKAHNKRSLVQDSMETLVVNTACSPV